MGRRKEVGGQESERDESGRSMCDCSNLLPPPTRDPAMARSSCGSSATVGPKMDDDRNPPRASSAPAARRVEAERISRT